MSQLRCDEISNHRVTEKTEKNFTAEDAEKAQRENEKINNQIAEDASGMFALLFVFLSASPRPLR